MNITKSINAGINFAYELMVAKKSGYLNGKDSLLLNKVIGKIPEIVPSGLIRNNANFKTPYSARNSLHFHNIASYAKTNIGSTGSSQQSADAFFAGYSYIILKIRNDFKKEYDKVKDGMVDSERSVARNIRDTFLHSFFLDDIVNAINGSIFQMVFDMVKGVNSIHFSKNYAIKEALSMTIAHMENVVNNPYMETIDIENVFNRGDKIIILVPGFSKDQVDISQVGEKVTVETPYANEFFSGKVSFDVGDYSVNKAQFNNGVLYLNLVKITPVPISVTVR